MSAFDRFTLKPMQNQGRRQFLKASLGVGVGAGLSGGLLSACTTLDRLILGGGSRDPKEVLILGAGLAGLTVAYQCKKNGIPFSIFEGSSRVGGRILTLREFNSAGQAADLGGEWISPRHEAILKLAKELAVQVSETTFASGEFAFFEGGKREGASELYRELLAFEKKAMTLHSELFTRGSARLSRFTRDELPRAREQDAISCEELIEKLVAKSSRSLQFILRRQVQMAYGAEPSQVSSLYWLTQIYEQNEFSVSRSGPMMRISGGSGVLAQALHDRIAGVIPGRVINTSHRLMAVSEDSSGFELQFQTPKGIKKVVSHRVVSTLPPSVLRDIPGVSRLSFEGPVHGAVVNAKMGDQAKGVLSFKERPWKKQYDLRRFTGTFESQNFWETEPRLQSAEISQRSLLSFQLGGKSALNAGLHSVDQAEKDLGALKFSGGYENISQLQNWSRHPWSQGGRSYFSPGQMAEFAGAFVEPQAGGKWLFAGEAVSLLWPGTMNGAVDSAMTAFQHMNRLSQKS
jgi:monoamine oxidase